MLNFYLLEKVIETNMRLAKTPGLALAIVRNHQVVYAQGFGVTSVEDGGLPVTPQTLFRIGSITKSMTATLIMRLVEMGKLDLDHAVTDYLPWLTFSQPEAAEQITLRLLLSHTAGLASSHQPFGKRDSQGLEEYIWEQIPRYGFVAPPGMLYAYSNPGMRLAGYVAEAVMKQPYSVLIQNYIFDPLKMTRTTFDTTIAMTYPLAQAHDLEEDGTLTVQHRYADNVAGYPSGGAISTVIDLANFAIMHMNGGTFPQQQLLTPEWVAMMHTPHANLYTSENAGYGLGFKVETIKGVRRIGHEGLISTFGCKLVMIPEAHTAVIMCFNRAAEFWAYIPQIVDYVVGSLLKIPTGSVTPNTIEPDRSRWAGYSGMYYGLERGIARIKVQNDQLLLDWNGDPIPLKALKPDLYCGEGVSVGFLPGGDYVMVNGSPCKRADLDLRVTVETAIWSDYVGLYRGVDKLIVRVHNQQVMVFSEEFGSEMPCIPLSNDTFVCKIGRLIFFPEDQTVHLGDGTVLKRVTSS